MDPQQGPPQPDLLIGQTIGNYLVTQKLGEGGMGAVYLAEHPSIGKKVALKVLHSEFSSNQEVAARFFHEAKAVNDIGHPNIVDIVDFGIIQAGGGREQLVYFIMEYLAGVTLSQVIRSEAPLPPERALMIALQVADALSASHKCGIVHRDLKPDNIILLQRGRERDFVKLLDFGIAKLTGGSAMGSHRTRTGIVMGTPAYMSPEQCEGRDTVDLRTDVYALGIVIYEMLTGRVPFLGEGYGEILVQHLTQRPAPVSQFRMLPAHVEAVVMKALEKRADMRYPTMEEFMRAMSDPVGYVEAHGGVAGFLQRQLMPSSAPLPSVRLTPAPLTPLPGTLIAPSASTPAPTTLNSATGQVSAPRRKAGIIIAALLVVGAAAAAIVVVAGGKTKLPDGGGGSAVASGEQGSDKVVAATDPGPGSQGGQNGTGPGSAKPIPPTFGSDTAPAGSNTPANGTGSNTPAIVPNGSNGAGSNVTPPAGPDAGSAVTVERFTEIDVDSAPPNAKIFVDGADTGKITPATLSVPRKPGKKLQITLRLKGYNNFLFKAVDAGENSKQTTDLVPVKTRPGGPISVGPGSGGRTNGSGTKNNGSGGTQGSADPDALMHP
jgi:eukaryotic-like serine/threonine-protein kinase